MMSVEIDPTERRAPAAARAGLRRPLWLGAASVGGLLAFGALAYPSVRTLLAPRPSLVQVGPVRDMPEIKDGIPALRDEPVALAASAPAPAPGVRVVEIPAAAAKTSDFTTSALTSPAPAAFTPPPSAAPTVEAAVIAKADAAPAVAPPASRADNLVTGTLTPPQRVERSAAAAVPKAPAPAAAPATRAAREAVPEPAKPAPVKAASHPAKPAAKVAAKREAPVARQAAAAPSAAPEQAEEKTFLGVPVPDFAPAGKVIKDTVDAVISLPSRL
ncbi:chemotaxis protein CheA [Methylobacterium sp. JK268]